MEEKIRRIVREFHACPLNGTDYVTYAMKERVRRVGKPDLEVPFYVGQTGDLGKRSLQHFKCGGQPTKDTASVYWRMYQIMRDYRIPVFEILERTQTLSASLLSESKWVHKFIGDGFQIYNQWDEHRPGKFSGSVPAKRLWGATLRQALMDNLRLSVACPKCGFQLELPLESIATVAPLDIQLLELRKTFRCPRCDETACLRLASYAEGK
ncbi:putative RNA-binding Zn-ribbon protein involved in translation (DUF1610 family) [Massilia umbonata]|uniref:Putative RNA-binding Zn-ribbon protein involved in translation (DUF1610 family) n=1 Tax=Pseudoduganella umbonata TaxID=864828 RepID=A0A7W5HB64_9BURK|nr:putative RNA-binding Zn-ribbon protein involved in translation (DUF1610 family) [Pseudoduganella umbonata]